MGWVDLVSEWGGGVLELVSYFFVYLGLGRVSEIMFGVYSVYRVKIVIFREEGFESRTGFL